MATRESSVRGRVGRCFWVLAGGAAVFLAVVHVGPAAGDAVEEIPSQYASPAAGVVALVILAVLVLGLVAHAAYELRRRPGASRSS